MADPTPTAHPREGGDPDGGWRFVEALFAPRQVTSLGIGKPGAGHLNTVTVTFAEGDLVQGTGLSLQAAWQALADIAEAGRKAATHA